MSITIKDLARMARVSHTTVSRALNDSPLINEQTKRKIKELAELHHYTPNINAKSLVTERSYQIGLFFSTLSSGTSAAFFHEAVKGVSAAVSDAYNLVVREVDHPGTDRHVSRKRFDGIILMSQTPEDGPFIDAVLEQDIPLVVLNRKIERGEVLNIVPDDRQGAYAAVEYLIRLGHRRIALIQGKAGFQSTVERTGGYVEALRKYGIEAQSLRMVAGEYDMISGYNAMKRLLGAGDRPTAVFCGNDEMAVGALKALHEKGIAVPGQMSVVGFDDSSFASFLAPAVTSVKRPIQAISRDGAERLLAAIGGPNGGEAPRAAARGFAGTLYVPAELIIRESASPPDELHLPKG